MVKLDSAAWSLMTLVLILVVIISTLGVKALNNERAARQLEQQALLEYQLSRFAQTINNKLLQSLQQWHYKIEAIQHNSDRLRELALSRQGIDLITITSHSGHRIFPPEKTVGALFTEKMLLQRYQTQFQALARQAQLAQKQQLDTVTSSTTSAGKALLNCWISSDRSRDKDKNRNNRENSYCVLFNAEWLETKLNNLIIQEQKQRQNSDLAVILVQTASLAKPSETHALENALVASGVFSQPLAAPFESWSLRFSNSALLQQTKETSGSFSNQQSLYPAYIAVLSPIFVLFLALAIQLYLKHREQEQQLQLRTTYTAQLAHEFRTPLTNLRLYSGLIKDEVCSDERDSFCDVLDMECQRLSNLVDNAIILACPSVDSTATLMPAIPNHTITEAVKSFQPALGLESIKVTTELTTAQTISFNQLALQCVLNNLLDNVTKYAAGSQVFIRSEFKQQQLVIQFRDTGPGIAPENVNHIFQPYQNSTTREKGFGLGLSVCHRLVHKAGGEIKLLSPSVGDSTDKNTNPDKNADQGTRFEITLPYQKYQDRT